MDYSSRRRRLTRSLKDDALDAFLVSNPVNVTYLTGFGGDSSYLILTRKQAVLVSDGRYAEQIGEECPGLDTYIRPTAQKLPEAAAQVLGKLGVRAVGFESGHLTVAQRERLDGL